MHFDRNPFACSREGAKKHLMIELNSKYFNYPTSGCFVVVNDFRLGTRTGRFPSNGAASMAVKGSKGTLIQYDNTKN